MPLPGSLARFNRVVTNRITRPFAAHLPGFGVLHHTGRATGLGYETPLNVFRHGNEVVVALTYGEDVDWLRNARAHPPSTLVIGGRGIPVGVPRHLPTEEGMAAVPAAVRSVLRMLGVTDFVAFPIDTSVNLR